MCYICYVVLCCSTGLCFVVCVQDQWELITIAPIACKQSALTNRQVVTECIHDKEQRAQHHSHAPSARLQRGDRRGSQLGTTIALTLFWPLSLTLWLWLPFALVLALSVSSSLSLWLWPSFSLSFSLLLLLLSLSLSSSWSCVVCRASRVVCRGGGCGCDWLRLWLLLFLLLPFL